MVRARRGTLPRPRRLAVVSQATPSTAGATSSYDQELSEKERQEHGRLIAEAEGRYLSEEGFINNLVADSPLIYDSASKKWAAKHGYRIAPFRFLAKDWKDSSDHRDDWAQILHDEYVAAMQRHFKEELGEQYKLLKNDAEAQDYLAHFLYKTLLGKIRSRLEQVYDRYTIDVHMEAVKEAVAEREMHEEYRVTQNLPKDKLATIGETLGYSRKDMEKAGPMTQLNTVYQGVQKSAVRKNTPPNNFRFPTAANSLEDDLDEDAA